MQSGQRKAFTLLELVIVIIIVGVLASLALPRFFRTIERSRAVEALAQTKAVRGAVERCYIMSGSLSSCSHSQYAEYGAYAWPSTLAIDDPRQTPNNHFDYVVHSFPPIVILSMLSAILEI